MDTTKQEVKHLVEVIAREVLIAFNENEYRSNQPAGDYCTSECAQEITAHQNVLKESVLIPVLTGWGM